MKLQPGTPEEIGMSAERIQHVVDLAAGWVAQGITPALVVLVAPKGVMVLREAFGRLTPQADSPSLGLDTIFPLMSLTKPITATAVMLLVEDGLLGLNRPVSEYIPEFVGEGKDAVMVHHLLTHTSGLRDGDVEAHQQRRMGTVEIPPPDETQHPGLNEWLFLGYDAPLWKPPGTEMSYCQYGYELLGETVRRVSGRPLARFARERIFDPLGMKDTHYVVPECVRQRIVGRPPDAPGTSEWAGWSDWPGFRSLFGGFGTRELQETPLASCGAYSTAMDMAVFGQMFLNGGSYGDTRILSPVTVAEMTRNQIPGISARYRTAVFPEASYGFGWNVYGNKKALYMATLHSPLAYDHGGGLGGFLLWMDPGYEIVGAYFSVAVRLMAHDEPEWPDLFINATTAAVVEV